MQKRTLGMVAAVGILIIGFLYITQTLFAYVVREQNEETLLSVDLRIAEQELLLVTIADLARRTEADAVTNRIVVDCSADERREFDTLLDTLGLSITPAELRQLDTLFYKCGSFYADRKAVMAARLYREV